MTATRRPNHLDGQTSPYLLQHLYNPVDWYPWGAEALQRARLEDRPIFLSIGYAACHWCHVMERESFENERIAALLNAHFVPIKVDREERPDIDEIYMNAVQVMTGQGGWPLSMFLTPDLRPFMGGTYFPPESRYGRPGFAEVLQRVHEAWGSRRSEIDAAAGGLTERLQSIASAVTGGDHGQVGPAETARAVSQLTSRFDPRRGGFGPAPKFPPDGALGLLLNEHARSGESVPLEMATRTLDGMALGGLYDHVGGGFARYSVDERWLVPHFEKMLYNQALLVPSYLDAWLLTRKPLYRRVVEETLDFVRRELTDPGGGFHSSLDADSEGEEGKFYVWDPDEILEVLGADEGDRFVRTYGITPAGNFEGRNIPNLLDTDKPSVESLGTARRRLLEHRERRVRPATDDKVLTAWNGLMITAFARAYQTLGRAEDRSAACAAAEFALDRLLQDGRLRVSYREGQARLNGYLDDYAFLGRGLLDLYEAVFDPRYLEAAADLAETLTRHFEDPEHGGFFFTSDDHETLLTRNRSLHDGALPAGSAIAVELLLRLATHLDRGAFRESAERTLSAYRANVDHMPSAYGSLLLAAEFAWSPPVEIAIIGAPDEPGVQELLAVVRGRYRLRPVVQVAERGATPLLDGRDRIDGQPTAYVCRSYACSKPTTDAGELAGLLDPD